MAQVITPSTPARQPSLWLASIIWLFFLYLYIEIVRFQHGQDLSPIIGGMYFIEFGIHELSHFIAIALPPLFTALAGSVGEVGFTTLVAYMGFRAKAHFVGIFGVLWIALAMNSVGRYMADARTQAMPLTSPGDSAQHDWYFIFNQLGWLEADTAIGTATRITGDLVGSAGLVLGLVLIIKIYISRS